MITYPAFHSGFDLLNSSILVTGGAGFIGSHLTDYLVQHGARRIRIVDNLSTGDLRNIKHHIESGKIEFHQTDLSDSSNCESAVRDIDIVFHQAALGSIPRSVQNPEGTHNANVNGFLYLLDAAREHGVKRFIYASSSSVYGDNISFPRPEEALGNPLSPYAVTKRINELYGQVYHRVYQMHTTGLRYFNIFGPRQNPEGAYAAAIPKFIRRMMNGQPPVIFGDGSQTRDFTFVANAVQANILALVQPEAAGEIFNIGLGGETSLDELVRLLSQTMPGAPPALYESSRLGDVARSRADIAKAQRLLGYKPFFTLEEGIRQTVAWYNNVL